MVAKYIKELLFSEEEVIVHDLGTFNCHYASAEIHPAAHSFSPPSKSISFDAKSKISNGVLERIIVTHQNVSKEKAQELVKQFVSTVKIELGIKQNFVIPDIGKLSLQFEDEITFIQDENFNYLEESYGLPDIFGEPVKRTEEEKIQLQGDIKKVATAEEEEETEKEAILSPKKKTPWGRIIAILALFFIVTWVLLVFFVNKRLNPFSFISEKDTTENEQVETDHEVHTPTSVSDGYVDDGYDDQTNQTEASISQTPSPAENSTNGQSDTKDTPKALETIEPQKPTEQVDDEFANLEMLVLKEKTGKAYIILGSFTTKIKALQFAQKKLHGGLRHIKIIPPFDGKTRYRVAYRSYENTKDAKVDIQALKDSLGQDIWALTY